MIEELQLEDWPEPDDLTERFSSRNSLLAHWDRHGQHYYPDLTYEEYEELATWLASQPLGQYIKGFQTGHTDGDPRPRFVKYDTRTGDTVMYGYGTRTYEPIVISMYRNSEEAYNNDEREHKIGEIPANR
jgi:hypothetical protein